MKKENANFQLCRVHRPALFKILLLVLSLSFLLSGCTSTKPPKNPEVVRSVEVVRLSQRLESLGVRVIQTGQTMHIILPSDKIFNPHSANLASSASRLLDTVSQLMVILETTSAQVAGYTDIEPAVSQNRALSARQAQVVADYLWSKGVDARLLYSVGYGTSKASPGLPGSLRSGANRRVEIQFQYLPLLSSLVN